MIASPSMAQRDSDGATTVRNAGASGARPNTVVVIGGNLFLSARLPRGGTGSLSVGRSAECDIRIDHSSVSRKHGVIHLAEGVSFEDAGSSNGTRIRGQLLAPGEKVPVTTDDVITLGSVTMFLQRTADAERPQRKAFEPIVVSAAMRQLYEQIDRVARSELSVLIVGETGAGKELVAERIHRRSARADGELMRLNCAALAESLIESQLFGHEKGAFTGALATKIGLLEAAAKGSMFLDEVGELPAAAQAKLLRALESREIMRVGAVSTRPIDVRFIAATNRVLDSEIAEGRFRQDLYYRLNGITLSVPPLRERTEEIEPLAARFMEMVRMRTPSAPARLTAGALDKLRAHAWPGNVRELRNVIERAMVLASGDAVEASDIELDDRAVTVAEPASPATPGEDAADERAQILAALEECAGNQTRAARVLGMSRRTLINRLEKYGITRPRKG